MVSQVPYQVKKIWVFTLITARKRSLRRLCFYRCLSVHTWGVGGMRGFILGRHAWFYSGGMHGFIQGCVGGFILGCVCGFIQGGHAWFYLGGHAWFYSGGMHGFIRGACMVLFGGMHGFIWGAWFFWGACVVFSVFSDTMRYGQ